MQINYPYGVISDVHFHAWTFGSYTTTNGVNSRLEDTIKEFKRACYEVRKAGGNDIVVTGDLFHTRGEIQPTVNNPVYDMFVELSEDSFDFHVLPGNHDLETDETTEHGCVFKAFSSIRGFNTYYKPTIVPIGDYGRGEYAIIIPWMTDRIYEAIQKEKNTKFDHRTFTLFGHAGLNDVLTGVKGSVTAIDIHNLGMRNAFFGHYHNHKHFSLDDGTRQSDVYSVGALTHQSFKDVGSTAGFIVVHSLENVRFHNSEAPEFINFDHDDWMRTSGLDPRKFTNNYVRMNFASKTASLSKGEILAIKSSLQAVGSLRVINQIPIDTDMDLMRTEGAAVYTFGRTGAKSLGEEFTKYVQSRYEKDMADKMLKVFEKDGIDES